MKPSCSLAVITESLVSVYFIIFFKSFAEDKERELELESLLRNLPVCSPTSAASPQWKRK